MHISTRSSVIGIEIFMGKLFTSFAQRQIEKIHKKSKRYNKLIKKRHSDVLLELMEKHISEICILHKEKDDHYIVETGDLFILCLELIKEAGKSLDAFFTTSIARYHKKLSSLMKTQNKSAK